MRKLDSVAQAAAQDWEEKPVVSGSTLDAFPAARSAPGFCRRRGPHLAVLAVVFAALAGVVVVMFVRGRSASRFPVPEKFSATVTAYEKLPNGTRYGAPLFTARAHRDGSSLRAIAELASAAGGQRHKFAAVDDVAAYQVFATNQILVDDEAAGDGPETLESVDCVFPGDAPSANDVHAALQAAYSVDEATMLATVGPGGCSGDAQRYLGQFSGVDIVVCMIDSFTFQVVSQDFVAYVDASTTVDYPAFEAVELPRDMDGNQLSCPSLSGLIAQAADIAATSRRRRLKSVRDCVNQAANNPLVGDCAGVAKRKHKCRFSAEQKYRIKGKFNYNCIPKDCTSKDLKARKKGKRRLCLPMDTGRRLGATAGSTQAEPAVRLVVSPEERVAKCSMAGRKPVKRCVFLHGAGAPEVDGSFLSGFTDSFPWYWGPVHHYVGQYCTEVKFIRLPTCNYAWDDPLMAKHFCYWAAGRGQQDISQSSFGDISDTVLFAHGAGNLIIAKALQSGACNLAPSSNWFEVQDGDHLSRMAKWNRDFCEEVANDPDGATLDAALDEAAAKRLELMGTGAPKSWESEERRQEWYSWRTTWQSSFSADDFAKLQKRQQQRRLVKTLGVCHTVLSPPQSFSLSQYTFTQNTAWLSLIQSGSDASTFAARVDDSHLAALGELIKTHVSGSMCAIDSANARHRATFHNVKPTAWSNDFEPYTKAWSRCWSEAAFDQFQPNPRYHSYSALTSFYEATCRFGNPLGEPADGVNRPCDWYQQMACATATAPDGSGSTQVPQGDGVVTISDDEFITEEEAADLAGDGATSSP